MSGERRKAAIAALRLAAIEAPPLSAELLKNLAEDKAFAYGFDGFRADEPFKCCQSEPVSWSDAKRRRVDRGREVKRALKPVQGFLRVHLGGCRYTLIRERRTIERLADAFEKMPVRYFETPLVVEVEPPALT